jgi:hypothetical protein
MRNHSARTVCANRGGFDRALPAILSQAKERQSFSYAPFTIISAGLILVLRPLLIVKETRSR